MSLVPALYYTLHQKSSITHKTAKKKRACSRGARARGRPLQQAGASDDRPAVMSDDRSRPVHKREPSRRTTAAARRMRRTSTAATTSRRTRRHADTATSNTTLERVACRGNYSFGWTHGYLLAVASPYHPNVCCDGRTSVVQVYTKIQQFLHEPLALVLFIRTIG
jgi:hypothetical protein